MTHSPQNCYTLTRKGLAALAEGFVGKLKPVLRLEESAAPFVALGCFDRALQQSGRLLLETGTAFVLLTPGGETFCQSSERNGDFVTDFANGPVKQALKDVSPLRSIRPIGSGTLRHGTLSLLDGEEKTHCRASLRVLSGKGGDTVAIVTLKGLRGCDSSLARLRKHIEAWGGKPMRRSRIHGILFPGNCAYDAKPEVIIGPDDTAFRAATDIIAAYIPVMRANEQGIIEDHDTEFLHDYRIALRKIRSVLGLFKGVYRDDQTRELKTRFSALMQPTGRMRDLDVYLLDRQHFYDLLPNVLHPGLDTMFEMFALEREAERARLARHLASKAYRDEIKSLAALFDRRKKLRHGRNADLGAREYACRLIWKSYRKICDTANRIGPDSQDAEVHLLRIRCKKLRYLMEFFGPLFQRQDFKALLKPLKTLQDNLGLYNDYSVQQASLREFLSAREDGPHDVTPQIAQTVGALIAVLHQKQLDERGRVVGNLAQFNSPETQLTFRTLFHGRGGEK